MWSDDENDESIGWKSLRLHSLSASLYKMLYLHVDPDVYQNTHSDCGIC